ncbi:amino acid adenylation domain-containing protein, partial [Francisellaceae bacterium]|nr:amino acid adenylation domain-containing protein [Francisellaceae bacterium]
DIEYKDFWFNYLDGYEFENQDLLLNKGAISNDAQIVISKILETDLSKSAIDLSKQLLVSVDVIFMAVYQVVLSKLLSKDDLVLGIVVNNRLQEEGGDKLFGLHLNTIPFRSKLESIENLENLIINIQANKHDLERYKLYPYGKLKPDIGIDGDLYQYAFNYIHFHVAEDNYKSNLVSSEYSHEQTNIPFTLNVGRYANNFQLTLRGLSNFIDNDTAQRFINYFYKTLDELVNNYKSDLQSYTLLPKEEYQKIVYDWNDTDRDYPKNKTIYQLFQEQVEQTPNNIAVVYEEKQLAYKELNDQSNQLARYIRAQYKVQHSQELKPDTLIALCLDRSEQMIISILAVLKAGGAYVPLDPSYPEDRIEYILSDTKAPLLLTQSNHADKLHNLVKDNDLATQVIDLSETSVNTDIHTQDKTNLVPQSQSTDLAYVIYTSGTTGKPKGVMVAHRGVVSLVCNESIIGSKEGVYVFLSSPVFDAAIYELYGSLLQGSSLIIPDNMLELTSDPKQFSAFIDKTKVTNLWLTKSLFDTLLKQDEELFKHIQTLIIGGEALNLDTVALLLSSPAKPNRIINGYGPTESTTFTTTYNINELTECQSSIPIGKPLNHRSCYILNSKQQPVPIGVVGELYIGGSGLARGYLNRPELTEERFIPNPFASESDIEKGYTRLYKTGDLVRWLPDGNLEYIGRNDDQVKIRGFRIELGEIDNTLSNHQSISQVTVLAKEREMDNGSNRYLVAYYVPSDIESYEAIDELRLQSNAEIEEQLIAHCNSSLPDYMIPSFFVPVSHMPLTVNGKLDKRALPEVDASLTQANYV